MDKSWVWLPRNSLEYVEGATSFASAAAKLLGDPIEMFCPCVVCRNLCHQPIQVVVDHLVIKGMDQKYKKNGWWSIHGEAKSTEKKADGGLTGGLEAFELLRTAFYDADEGPSDFANQNIDDTDDGESKEEYDFKKKLKEAETPLYSRCNDYTKVSAIIGLYRIKVKSGMSENYFDQLLNLVHDMLPGDNVLPTSTYEIKKFLKMFGFGYDVIHACKNDCILFRKEYEGLQSCPRCNASRWERDKHTGEEKEGIPAKALHENITWSFHHVHEMATPSRDESAEKRITPTRSISTSTGSTNKSVQKKCILLDCNNSGEIVAEGKLFPSNPEDTIHNAPLGPNASKVWVVVPKIGDAKVWRPTPEFETITDALGTIIAWPNNKLKFV